METIDDLDNNVGTGTPAPIHPTHHQCDSELNRSNCYTGNNTSRGNFLNGMPAGH